MTSKLSTALRRVRARHPDLLSAEQFAALLRAVEVEEHEPEPKVTVLGTAKTKEELLVAEAAWWA